ELAIGWRGVDRDQLNDRPDRRLGDADSGRVDTAAHWPGDRIGLERIRGALMTLTSSGVNACARDCVVGAEDVEFRGVAQVREARSPRALTHLPALAIALVALEEVIVRPALVTAKLGLVNRLDMVGEAVCLAGHLGFKATESVLLHRAVKLDQLPV